MQSTGSASMAMGHLSSVNSAPKRTRIPLWMRWRKFWGVMAIILAIVGVSIYNLNASDAALLNNARQSVTYLAERQAADITRQLRTSVSSLQALDGILQIDRCGSGTEDFDRLAKTLIDTYGGISNLQLAPFGTIRQIYPLVDENQDNRGALGLALLLSPSRRDFALQSIVSRTIQVSGPLKLVQGGIAAIAQRPIFSRYAPKYLPDETYVGADGVNYTRVCSMPETRDETECSFPGPLDPSGEPTYFWGFVTMLTGIEDFLQTTSLSSLETGGQGGVAGISQFAYELSDPSPHPSLAEEGGIWQRSSRTESLADAVKVDVAVEEFAFRWILKVAPLDGWPVVSDDFWRQLLLVLPLTAMLGVFLGVYIIIALRKEAMKQQGLARYRKSEKIEIIHNAVANLITFQFPMYLVELREFIDMGCLVCHEEARDNAKLCCFDRPEDVVDVSILSGVIFISHQWAGFEHPDPQNVHYQAILVAVNKLQEKGLKCGYIWVDYTSIPQANSFQQQAAINSLSVYASLCSSLVSVAPRCRHADTGALLDLHSYCSRGWCRLELLSFKTGSSSMGDTERAAYICDGCDIHSTGESSDDISDDAILHVLGGTFSCCSRMHPKDVQCDRHKTRDVLLGIYWRLMAMRRDGDMTSVIWADRTLQLVQTDTEKYFPSYNWYRTEDIDEMVELFEGYLPMLHKMFDKDSKLDRDGRLPVFGRSSTHLMTI